MSGPRFLRSYAGKARPAAGAIARGVVWHPLAYHCLDVAAACAQLLQARPGLLRRLAEVSELPPDLARTWLLFAAALHDLGKFADGWQAKLDLRLDRNPPFPTNPPKADHAAFGPWIWHRIAQKFSPEPPESFDAWLASAASHHGLPVVPRDDLRVNAIGSEGHISATAIVDATAFATAVMPIVGAGGAEDWAEERSSWLVSGIVTIADWIGSNQNWFPYEPPLWTLQEYWPIAQKRAEGAIDAAGLDRAKIRRETKAAALIGGGERALTPLQDWAARSPDPKAPTLAILEDLTGAGKTEAALILAHRWMVAGQGSGLYFALPTQATANAMADRLRHAAPLLLENEPNLVLAHAAADIAAPLLAISPTEAGEQDHPDGAIPASAAAAVWLADERRKAFLAEIGVGTIDQALMIGLPTRFQPVRAAALADRVLIVDEAHSFDAYTTELLCALLRFQAMLGGSAIILSATLTKQTKDQLLRAFAEGRRSAPTLALCRSFPLATLLEGGVLTEEPVQGMRGTRRDLPVERLAQVEAAARAVLDAAESGGCAVWIRNTVQDAIDGAALTRAMAPEGVTVDLFHARFTIGDRAKIEQAALARFGRTSTPKQRRKQVLIGTQVVEQSLNLDFDVMVSDLAPLDLLIQRAGRLHRHDRPGREGPVLRILAPDPEAIENGNWYASMFPRAAFVYAAHGRLHLGLKRLLAEGLNLASGDPRALLESVLGADADPHPLLQNREDAAWGRRHTERTAALQRLLDPRRGYVLRNHFEDDARAKTRLSEETRTLRLARWENGRLSPWNLPDAPDDEDRAWRLSEISVKRFRANSRPAPDNPALAGAIAAAEARWGRRAQEALLVPLHYGDQAWWGSVVGAAGELLAIAYDGSGLRFQPSPPRRG